MRKEDYFSGCPAGFEYLMGIILAGCGDKKRAMKAAGRMGDAAVSNV